MENKIYTIRFPAQRKYEIEIINLDNKPIAQKSADDAFIIKLFNIALANGGSNLKSKNAIFAFLNFQLEKTTATHLEFLKHTEKIFRENEDGLRPFHYSIGYVYDWIEEAKKKLEPIPPKKLTTKPSKMDPTFDEIVKDKDQIKKIIHRFQQIEIIGNDLEWRGSKSELVAFIQILLDDKIIKSEKRALLGRIFSKEFQCKMNTRNFNTVVKTDTIERLRLEIKGL